MTLQIPCGRFDSLRPGNCAEGSLCPYCAAIRILRATCLGVADRLDDAAISENIDVLLKTVDESTGRLRADVARFDGSTE